MPRPAKTARRQFVNAGLDYKRGKRKEAYEGWEAAAKARKERLAGKQFKKKRAEEAAAVTKAEAEKAEAEKAAAEKVAAEKAAAEKAAADTAPAEGGQ